MSPFQPRQDADIAALIDAYPLAWVLSGSTGKMAATPLPLLAETDADGSTVSLFGHFALSNPHVAQLQANARATIQLTVAQSRLIPVGAVTRYEIQRLNGANEEVFLSGLLMGEGGDNPDG